jgi:hypothetical protein
VISTALEGEKANERYARVKEGCVFNLALGECVDEIELKKLEAGKVNDYCMIVEDKGTTEKAKECAILKM